MRSLLGKSFGDAVAELISLALSNIPKAIYFMYACIASALDALQGLMRRLAGLDVYYDAGNNAIEKTDPVLEFIYGTLGIGKNAGQYSALTTTFWSLAIFGIIVLAVGTMIAIIRAHYQEDSAKTSPMSYIYNAFKAILTFAIVPVAVIIGIQLSSFLLTTLDNITAGSATAESIDGIYGSNARELLAQPSGNRGYSNYDFFGFRDSANKTTIYGMLFKAVANDANRVRLGTYSAKSQGSGIDGVENALIFGDGNSPGMQTASDRNEYLAYQIDYAFSNNLKLKEWYRVDELGAEGISFKLDFICGAMRFNSFSKYNVGLVWTFYDLWRFNFIVGFAAVFTIFGMFVSIIIGLMSRLIKSIALFLIYPATLGLASLDDFGAFRKWRGEFMKQILAAFGSIIGMNIFFLIFPFLSTISFYPQSMGVINYLVNIVILITGLLVTKSFIEFVSGLVGGANALSEGEGLKGNVGKTLMTGVKKTVGGGVLANKLNPAYQLGKYATGKISAKVSSARDMKKAQKLEAKADKKENKINWQNANDNIRYAERNIEGLKQELNGKIYKDGSAENKEYLKLKSKYLSKGMSAEEADEQAREAMYSKDKDIQREQSIINNGGLNGDELASVQKADAKRRKADMLTQRATAVRERNYLDKDGKLTRGAVKAEFGNFGRDLAGAFFKNFSETLGDMKINVGALKGLFYQGSNKTVDEKGSVTGETWQIKAWDPNKRIDDSGKPKASFGSVFSQFLGGNRQPDKKESVDKIQEKAAKDTAASAKKQEESAAKTAKEMAAMRQDFQKLINSLNGIVKNDK